MCGPGSFCQHCSGTSLEVKKGSGGGNVNYQGEKASGQKAGQQNISSKDRAKGLPGLQMVSSLVALGIPLLRALGMCPAILEPPKDSFVGRLQAVGAARLDPRTAVAWTGYRQL